MGKKLTPRQFRVMYDLASAFDIYWAVNLRPDDPQYIDEVADEDLPLELKTILRNSYDSATVIPFDAVLAPEMRYDTAEFNTPSGLVNVKVNPVGTICVEASWDDKLILGVVCLSDGSEPIITPCGRPQDWQRHELNIVLTLLEHYVGANALERAFEIIEG